jgi:hypothetical protein
MIHSSSLKLEITLDEADSMTRKLLLFKESYAAKSKAA